MDNKLNKDNKYKLNFKEAWSQHLVRHIVRDIGTVPKGFTLLEIIIALTVFTIVMAMVIALLLDSMRSVQRGEKALTREQSKRICYLAINKEVSSLTKVDSPGFSFSGNQNGFFLSLPVKIALRNQGTFLIAPPLR